MRGAAAGDSEKIDVEDIDLVIERLSEIVAWSIENRSRAGYFAAMYRKVTVAVRQGIVDGHFSDGQTMARFDRIFAQRYVDAFEAWRAGGQPSAAWQVAFDATGQRRLLILQHLLIGMNAHINLDLGIAAAEVAPGHAIHGLKRDFDAINVVLAGLIDDFEDDIGGLSPWIGWLERFGGRTDDELIRFSLNVARAKAWQMALDLAAAPDPGSRTAIITHYDQATALLASVIRWPGPLTRAGMLAIRVREVSDVATVIGQLS